MLDNDSLCGSQSTEIIKEGYVHLPSTKKFFIQAPKEYPKGNRI